MNVWGSILRLFGWDVNIIAPVRKKCVICVAPHTSNWDFILGLFAYRSLGRNANFLMKESWFFFPLKYVLRYFGGIPVAKKGSGGALTCHIIDLFATREYMNLAVTPEGTRSAQANWRSGFLHISHEAGVPIQFGIIDYKHKRIIIRDEFHPTGDVGKDMETVKRYFSEWRGVARYPDKFKVK